MVDPSVGAVDVAHHLAERHPVNNRLVEVVQLQMLEEQVHGFIMGNRDALVKFFYRKQQADDRVFDVRPAHLRDRRV